MGLFCLLAEWAAFFSPIYTDYWSTTTHSVGPWSYWVASCWTSVWQLPSLDNHSNSVALRTLMTQRKTIPEEFRKPAKTFFVGRSVFVTTMSWETAGFCSCPWRSVWPPSAIQLTSTLSRPSWKRKMSRNRPPSSSFRWRGRVKFSRGWRWVGALTWNSCRRHVSMDCAWLSAALQRS